jgi:hypothetical protein
MQIIVYAVDASPGHLVEAGFDHFRVEPDSMNATSTIQNNTTYTSFYPNPLVNNKVLNYDLPPSPQSLITLSDVTGRTIESFNVNNSKGSISLNKKHAAGTYMINVFQNGIKISTDKLFIIEE